MPDNTQSIVTRVRPELSSGWPAALDRGPTPQPQLSIPDIWRTLVRWKLPILLFAGIVFSLVAAYTFLKTPLYEGVVRLQIDPSRSSSLGLDDNDKSTNTDFDSRVKTEVEIIQSDTVATRVMKSLEL